MRLEDFLTTNADSLGRVWFGPVTLNPALRLVGTDTALVFEVTWTDGAGAHVECWTAPDAYQANCFQPAPAGASGG